MQDGGIPIGVNRNAAKDMKGSYCFGHMFRQPQLLLDVREEYTIEMMRAILILQRFFQCLSGKADYRKGLAKNRKLVQT